MDNAKEELVRSWLKKAKHDIEAAQQLATSSQPLLDVAIYHCQQAAEKAVKGFLVHHDQEFEKTHDIVDLLETAIPFDAQLSSWLEAGERLTPYVSLFRYPGAIMEPDSEEFDEALKLANELYHFILTLLPKETHP